MIFMCHLKSSHDAPSTSRDMTTISKMGPMIVEGPVNTQGSKAKVTLGVAHSWHLLGPHR
jgi:hypothetical protein